MPRPDQMNINVATWGRLLKKNINLQPSIKGNSGQEQREIESLGKSFLFATGWLKLITDR